MYITDPTHISSMGPARSRRSKAARAMAQFLVDVVAHATDESDASLAAPTCFKMQKGPVTAVRAADDAVVWKCPQGARQRAGSRSGRGRSGTCRYDPTRRTDDRTNWRPYWTAGPLSARRLTAPAMASCRERVRKGDESALGP